MENAEAWAQLVCTTDIDCPPLPISKDKFTIGRAKACDVCLGDNKLVSGIHCFIQRKGSGEVWLHDTSTNGTLLNMNTKISKGNCRLLNHGDEFFVVFKKDNEKMNIGYVYQDMKELAKEQDTENDQTLEYDVGLPDATFFDEDINMVPSSPTSSKRSHEHASKDDGPPRKRKRNKADVISDDSLSDDDKLVSSTRESKRKGGGENTESLNEWNKEAIPEKDGQSSNNECKELPSEMSKKTLTLISDPTKSDKKVSESKSDKSKTAGVKEVKIIEEPTKIDKESTECKSDQSKTADDTKTTTKEEPKDDVFAETLLCIICQEILHDCISLQPCMHSFCAGCYSDWMQRSKECPSCRLNVDRINKNHIVNNLVEAYLKEHPEKKRPDEDIKELESKNKITRDMLYADVKRRSSSPSESSDDYNDTDSDQDQEDDSTNSSGFSITAFGATAFPKTVCRQCPGYVEPVNTPIFGSGVSGVAGPSTDAGTDEKKPQPTPPPFVCAPNQNHSLCHCCLRAMPNRLHEINRGDDIPPQQCSVCFVGYCHMYWGCRNDNCRGCLSKFKDLNFGDNVLITLVLNNFHESAILTNYLKGKNISVRELFQTCQQKLESKEFKGLDTPLERNLHGNSVICYTCGLRTFRDLAYQYRQSIPNEDLPDEVRNRPDCYWGRNCRTQTNKPAHAMKFNHICEQTRAT